MKKFSQTFGFKIKILNPSNVNQDTNFVKADYFASFH
jgi:hypothetical protein